MLRKLLVTLTIAFGCIFSISAQSGQGTIKGKILDGANGEPVPFANVTLISGVDQVIGTTTDFDGEYTLKPIPPGTYNLRVSYVGYQTKEISGVVVSSGKIVDQSIKISAGIELKEVEIIEYTKPLFEKDQTTVGTNVSREEIEKMAVRSVADIAKTAGNGVFSRDDGSDALNVRGQRDGSSITFIDGVKVIGTTNLPKSAIEEVSVKTGGLSAQYGDLTGGVTSITTRGAFKSYFGSAEVLSSGFKSGDDAIGLDNYGYNLFGFAAGGPIITKKDDEGNVKDAPLGFLLTGEYRSILDPRPSAVAIYKPKDQVEREIRDNPLFFDESSQSVLRRAEFLTADDFEEIDFHLNSNDKEFVVNGKFDIKISDLSALAVGGTFSYEGRNNFTRDFALYNHENNSETVINDYRIWGRYTQRFENEELEEGEESTAVVKNAFFTIQADFSRRSAVQQDRNHENDFFRYGYVGKFEANTEKSYGPISFATLSTRDENGNVIESAEYLGSFLTGFDAPISYDFTPSDINQVLSNYTSNFYSFFPAGSETYESRLNVEGGGGIINGGEVNGNIYNIWTAAGTPSNRYNKIENDQIRLTGNGSADIGDHAIILGFEYEQRIERDYLLDPRDLWDLGRGTVNNHIEQIDSSLSTASVSFQFPDPITPTITFERRYGGDDQRTDFAYNMRRALGFDPSGTGFVDFDSYDISLYNMNYFAADQLINPSNNINLQYRGYDYQGKKLNSSPSLDDFFNERNELGSRTRPIPAYQPIYIAGYLEDKFAFDDLIFRVGLRLDRFDANQPVLKDQYAFFPTRDVAFAKNAGLTDVPSNIGNDFVVYVGDIENPSTENVVGYRDPETDIFYNSRGEELNDPTVLQSGSSIAPWLIDPQNRSTTDNMSTESFEDYEPQYTLMPRISFSFPISDEATFFANYDILTQRPGDQNALEPIDIIYVANHNRIINNPNLKPTKTISYELGFKQKLTNSSSLSLSTFYKEQRDEIQVRRLVGAFPEDYLTYGNLDFGTVKGFTVDYDLRRTKNVSFKINYTIQFAEGTGSGTTSALNLVRSDEPNLRTIFPYSYDQRHQIVSTIDYRYGSGRNYNGPKIGGKDILENTGLNLVFQGGSGTPYTARSLPTQRETLPVVPQNGPVSGDINGSRLPWVLRVNARLDKSFDINWGSKSEANQKMWDDGKKQSTLNVYVQVLNLFDRQNVRRVYGYTGNSDDDGYLNSPLFQDQIRQQQSEQAFRDQYSLRLFNLNNYELPRRIRLGAQLSF